MAAAFFAPPTHELAVPLTSRQDEWGEQGGAGDQQRVSDNPESVCCVWLVSGALCTNSSDEDTVITSPSIGSWSGGRCGRLLSLSRSSKVFGWPDEQPLSPLSQSEPVMMAVRADVSVAWVTAARGSRFSSSSVWNRNTTSESRGGKNCVFQSR